MPKIGGEHTETILISGSGRTWTFRNNSFVHAADQNGIFEPADVKNNTIILHGIVQTDPNTAAILLMGKNTRLEIAEDARIRGYGAGIASYSEGAEIVNKGIIKGNISGSVGIYGDNSEFRNSGTVLHRVQIYADDTLLINNKGGLISHQDGAVSFGHGETGGKLINHGKLATLGDPETTFTILAYDRTDSVINDGTIVGQIRLGGSNDIVDNRGGKITGKILSGLDDDVLITDKASDRLTEYLGEGDDLVKSTVTYTLNENVERLTLIGNKNIDAKGNGEALNYLVGNSGNNTLWGFEGSDVLDGRGGNDLLRGGAGQDNFSFATGYDKDTIHWFEQGLDEINIDDWEAIDNFSALKSHAKNHGDDVWIKAGGDTLVIRGLNKADLSETDFNF